LVFVYFMLLLRILSTKHPNKKVDYVMNNIIKIMSKLLRSAVEISPLQQQALLVATIGDNIHHKRKRTN